MFALAIVMVVVLPFIDATVSYDTAKAGDVIEVQGDVTFVPEAGWAITSGIRAGDPPRSGYRPIATLSDGGVIFVLRTAPFDGDANALLDQITTTSDAPNGDRGVHATGERTTIVTDEGEQGVIARVTGPQTGSVMAAFMFDARGVVAVASGLSNVDPEPEAAVFRMIRSISHHGKDPQ